MRNHLFGLIALFLLPSVAGACDCIGGEGRPETLLSYDSVFRGLVISVDWILPTEETGSREMAATFLVREVWKGQETPVQIVFGGYGANCLFPFEERTEYVVFAKKSDKKKGSLLPFEDELYAVMCSHTATVNDAEDALDYLASWPSKRVAWSLVEDAG